MMSQGMEKESSEKGETAMTEANDTASAETEQKQPSAPNIELLNEGKPQDLVLNMPTIFESIPQQNVIFCIDTSGSMYNSLEAVKQHLVEALMQRAQRKDTMFNILEFSNEVTQWSDQMVLCTPETVAVARDWIEKLEVKTGTNTMDALMTAFRDQLCDAVCLVTDGHPDQHPTDILDRVSYAAQNRPVHCIYIYTGQPETSASEFLQDLAMETYGSFHVVSVTLHGCIEKVTPVYRAELAAERIIRTTDGSIYPSNHKICSVTTSLTDPVPEVVYDPYLCLPPPLYPYYFYPYPLRYYYQCIYPEIGWSRYRAAHRGLQTPTIEIDSSIPGPGATLIGQKVLARRSSDGYFYLGTVKSQILANKFLIEFGPCKHGKYKSTTYQETFVYDVVSYVDALRHSVCVGDQVLAPWEPEGERYGPGTVIKGQEKRVAQGGIDEDVIVSFHNGKSLTVPNNTACWIPRELHKRITFELDLPKQVRCEFAEQDKPYPEDNLPGYPTSGPRAVPTDYQVHESGWLARHDVAPARQIYSPFYIPYYSIYDPPRPQPDGVSSPNDRGLIPGTEFTKAELTEKVMSQLKRHRMIAEDEKEKNDTEKVKLLEKREKQAENTLAKSFERSVTFKERESENENEREHVDNQMRDFEHESLYDAEFSDLEIEEKYRNMRDVAVGTDSSLLYRPISQQVRRRPPWRYWKNEPAPQLIEPMHEGPYRMGPYEEPIAMIPAENRAILKGEHGVEWTTSMSSFTDYLAKSRQGEYGVWESLHMPRPPDYKPEKQPPGKGVSEALHGKLSEADKLILARMDFRRKRTLQRENELQEKHAHEDKMAQLVIDQHHERIQAQLSKDKQRHLEEINRIQQLREAKKQVNAQLRTRIEENQNRERARDEQRLTALKARRERREEIRLQREREIEQIKVQRQLAKQERIQTRWNSVTKALDEQEAQEAARFKRAQSAKHYRLEKFKRKEDDSQKHKQYLAEVNDKRSAIFLSNVFP